MLLLLTAVLVAAADQISKYLVVTNMYRQSIPVLEGVFGLAYVENTGAAFGIFSGNRVFLILFSIAAVALIVFLVFRIAPKSAVAKLSAGLIIGGAAGNLIDRIRLGYVVDFLEIQFFSFPVFNVADICVVCGAILLVCYILFGMKGQNGKLSS